LPDQDMTVDGAGGHSKLVSNYEAEVIENLMLEDIMRGMEARKEIEWRFARLSSLMSKYEAEQYWRRRGFVSMNSFIEWMSSRTGASRSSLYGALWVGRRLQPHLDESTMRGIGKSKLYILAGQVVDGTKPRPEMVALAETSSVVEFEALVRSRAPLLEGESPSDLKMASVGPFVVTAAEKRAFKETLELGRRIEGVESEGRLLMMMCELAHAYWLEQESAAPEASNPEVEGMK